MLPGQRGEVQKGMENGASAGTCTEIPPRVRVSGRGDARGASNGESSLQDDRIEGFLTGSFRFDHKASMD